MIALLLLLPGGIILTRAAYTCSGPKMMSHIRSIDRQQNHAQYPLLYYPELYVMKGGYKAFFLEPQTTVSSKNKFSH